jgi:holliday junction DNA helicase RuvA
MIGFLRGVLLQKAPPQLLLDVQGVGYEVEAPMTTFYDLPAVGESVRLFTHLVVREDAHVLFGFGSETERLLFRTLIKVNGVGPKLALTILSGQPVTEFYRCVREDDVKSLVRLPGVGQKTAERLIVELRDRLPEADVAPQAAVTLGGLSPEPALEGRLAKQEAIAALCALGYKPQEAQRMVRAVADDDLSCEEIIRQALRGAMR